MELTAFDFYALHQSLILKAFGREDILAERNNSQIYGLNNYDGDVGTLGGKMVLVLKESVYAKALYDYKQEFNRKIDQLGTDFDMNISAKHLNQYVRYLERTKSEDFKIVVSEFYEKKGTIPENFPLKKILVGDQEEPHSEPENFISQNQQFHPNITQISNSQDWWLYFYEYLESDEKRGKRLLMRILFRITKVDGDYCVDYINSSPKYTNYYGKISVASSKELIIQLKGGDPPKRLILIFNVDIKGNKPLYIGIYAKHDSSGKVYSGSVILYRIPGSVKDRQARIFRYNEPEIEEVPQAIRRFFYHKSYTFLKTPKIYDLQELDDWLDRKMRDRGEIPEYDLFIAAPILGLKKKIESYKSANRLISSELKRDSSQFSEATETKLSNALKEIFFENSEPGIDSFGYLEFHHKVQNFEEALEERYRLNIYYSRSRKRFSIDSFFPYPTQTFNNDISAIKKARAFILICPYPHIFSSCWVQVGWAITLNLPIFLICPKREYLTFILTAASVREHIELIEMDFTMDLDKILQYLEQNDLWRKTFLNTESS